MYEEKVAGAERRCVCDDTCLKKIAENRHNADSYAGTGTLRTGGGGISLMTFPPRFHLTSLPSLPSAQPCRV